MERWAPAPARERPRRRAGQPSFSSSLLDAICDSLDEQPTAAERAAARSAGSGGDKKQQDAAALHCYYYYKPSLAASHRAAPPPADDCSVRGYFSSSEVEHSLHRLRPIRTSAGGGAGAASVAPAEKHHHHQQQQPPAKGKTRKPSAAAARGGCRRPASPGARLASLINAIFYGKRHSARQHPAPADEEPPACSTAPSTARPCLAQTPPLPSARARPRARRSRSRTRTVRFLDIDGEVAVAAAAAGCRRVPVVEVEEHTDGGGGGGGGEESSDASSDLFELKSLAAIAPGSGGACCRRACGDELPVYGTTGAGLRHDIGRRRRRPFGYGSHGPSCSRVV